MADGAMDAAGAPIVMAADEGAARDDAPMELADGVPKKMLWGHPGGLYLLFTAEMWERMSFYGMRALLVLYMTNAFGWQKGSALKLYGIYCGLVYLTPMAGGWLADKILGQRRSIVLGGALMVAGHFLMAAPGKVAFFGALALIIVGNGFFKPNISTIVGGLYRPKDPRRDAAFNIFYIGINVGAFLAGMICGTLGEKVGYHWGFGSAGVGMALGLLVFAWGANRFLGTIGLPPSRDGEVVTPAPDASEPAIITVRGPLTKVERDGIGVILILAVFSIFFWVAFEQAGGLMNLYTDEKVDRFVLGWEVPTTWFQSLNPFFIVVLGLSSPALWKFLRDRGKEPSTPAKMGLGILFLSLGFVLMVFAARQSAGGGKAALLWIVGAYFLHTTGEMCLSPIGLSMVTKLAPAHLASRLMGVWFFANFISDTLAGFLGSYSEQLGELQLFTAIVAATGIAGVVLLGISRPLTRAMHGKD